MAAFSISVMRCHNTDLVDVVSFDYRVPATDKAWKRPLNYEMLVGSHLPVEHQHTCGALAVAVFRAEQRVEKITIWQNDAGVWLADADVYDIRPYIRRGEGNTPVEALVALIRDLYKY